ncbi:MAG: hypothetical protein QF654_10275 [Alphaproteobacteria bacterium]|jgi:hypothetical protein|nr:hypothetical protein [Alphaproteobacteria bacterium]MDP6604473.1 hypothetical protein [Rhodospirillales bacterium]
MVVSASNPLTGAGEGSARPAQAQPPIETPLTGASAIGVGLTRAAFTSKFGPDPDTGEPLRFVAGADVEAAETNDVSAIVDKRLGAISAGTLFQATQISNAASSASLAQTTTAGDPGSAGAATAAPTPTAGAIAPPPQAGDQGQPLGGLVDIQI